MAFKEVAGSELRLCCIVWVITLKMIQPKGRIMAIEKKTGKEKTRLKIKARIGAWWKSTVLTENEVTAENRNNESDSKKGLKETVKEIQPKSPSRGKTAVRSSDALTREHHPDKIVNTEVNLESEIIASPTEEKTVSPKKRTAKKPRRQKSSLAPAKSDSAEDSSDTKLVVEPVKRKEPSKPTPVRKLLINAEEPEECRIALLEDGRLESIHVSSVTRTRTKNNIYKAKIVAIEPSLQAAFVDYGTDKNGFLPFSEIHPEYYKEELGSRVRELVEAHQWKKLSIVDVVEKGQEILAQVVKEEVGRKGANMTTYLSLPGRCVVLMPGSDSSGIDLRW